MPNISVFTCKYAGIVKRLQSRIYVCYGTGLIETDALWDTGATITCISYDVVSKLKIPATGLMTVLTPSGSKDVSTYLVDIILPNHIKISDVQVCGSDIGEQGLGVLIGMDIITQGDFILTNSDGKTAFTFKLQSIL